MALCRKLALEETMDLSQDEQGPEAIIWNIYIYQIMASGPQKTGFGRDYGPFAGRTSP